MMRDEVNNDALLEKKETPRAACTRKVLYAVVFGVMATVVAGVCLDDGARIDPQMGDHLIFSVLIFLPIMAGSLTYSYRYYIGINSAMQREKGDTDFRALLLFAFGFICPPLWLLNAVLYSSSSYQRTKFFAALSMLATLICAAVVALFFIP